MNDVRYKILVVDDEPMNIQLLEGALKGDYDIYSALGGADAICSVKEHMPDLILLDVMMPDINGFEVSREIKSVEMFSAIPILFLTAMDTIDAEAEGLDAGGIDYLTKPINLNLLKLRVRNHLELKRQNDLIREQKKELESALARIKQLEGIIPICMYCKSIRTEDASWQTLEQYITEHSDAFFSHGVCPSCFAKYFPEVPNATR